MNVHTQVHENIKIEISKTKPICKADRLHPEDWDSHNLYLFTNLSAKPSCVSVESGLEWSNISYHLCCIFESADRVGRNDFIARDLSGSWYLSFSHNKFTKFTKRYQVEKVKDYSRRSHRSEEGRFGLLYQVHKTARNVLRVWVNVKHAERRRQVQVLWSITWNERMPLPLLLLYLSATCEHLDLGEELAFLYFCALERPSRKISWFLDT